MRYSRELLRKPIISADRNEKLGVIHGFVIDPDERRVAAFVLEQTGPERAFQVVPFSTTKSIYTDAVLVENIAGPMSLNDAPTITELIMKDIALVGSHVITETGMLAGAVSDFAFSERSGVIEHLRISPEPGFPQICGMGSIIKIARERIMVSRTIYDEKNATKMKDAPLEEPPTEPEETAPVAPPPETSAMETVAAAVPPEPLEPEEEEFPAPAHEPEMPAAVTPRVDAMRMRIIAEQIRKDLMEDLSALFDSRVKDQIQAGLRDAVRMLAERIEGIDPAKHLGGLREELAGEMSGLVKDTAAELKRERAAAEAYFGATLDEKLKAGITGRLDAAEKKLETLEGKIYGLAEAGSATAADSIRHITEALEKSTAALNAEVRSIPEKISTGEELDAAVKSLKEQISRDFEALRGVVAETAASLDVEAPARAAGQKISEEAGALREQVRAALDDAVAKVAAEIEKQSEAASARAGELLSKIPEQENLSPALDSLKERIEQIVPDIVEKQSENVRQMIEKMMSRLSAVDRFDMTVENLREEFAMTLPDLLEKYFERIKSETDSLPEKMSNSEAFGRIEQDINRVLNESLPGLSDAVSERISREMSSLAGRVSPAAEAVERLGEKLKQEFAVTIPDLFRRHSDAMKQDISALSEKIPAADSFDRTAEKLKYELSLILPELFAKQFDELKHRTEEMAAAMPTADTFNTAAQALVDEYRFKAEERIESLEQRLADTSRNLSDGLNRVINSSDALPQLLEAAHAEADRRIAALRSEVDDLLRSELARHAESTLAKTTEFEEAIGRLRETLHGLRQDIREHSPETLKQEFFGELRAFAETTPRAEDIVALRQWIETTTGNIAKAAAAESREGIEEGIAAIKRMRDETAVDIGQFRHDMESLRGALREQLENEMARFREKLDPAALKSDVEALTVSATEKAGQAMREKFERLEMYISEIFAGKQDELSEKEKSRERNVEELASRTESRVNEAAEKIAEYVDRRISERDDSIEQAFQRVAAAIDALVTRPQRLDLGNIFSGGLLNIFGGGESARKSDSSRMIGSTKPARKSGPQPSNPVEAAQVRRLSYLIGKTMTRDIADREGMLIARCGDTVNEDIIRECRDAHRILDLIRSVDLSGD